MTQIAKPPAKTREVFDHLKSCAGDMRTVTYKELGQAVGLPPMALGNPLGYIRDHIRVSRKLPLLNFIAVQTDSRRPGESFLREGLRTDIDDELFWRGMVSQVFAFNWDDVPFDE